MYNSDADAEGEPDDQFESSPPRLQNQGLSLKIKLNPQRKMARSVNNEHIGPRRSSRHAKSSDSPAHPSGSEYSAGSASPSSPVDQGPKRRRRNVDYTEDDEFTQKLQAKNEAQSQQVKAMRERVATLSAEAYALRRYGRKRVRYSISCSVIIR